jgi:hypothetical protein
MQATRRAHEPRVMHASHTLCTRATHRACERCIVHASNASCTRTMHRAREQRVMHVGDASCMGSCPASARAGDAVISRKYRCNGYIPCNPFLHMRPGLDPHAHALAYHVVSQARTVGGGGAGEGAGRTTRVRTERTARGRVGQTVGGRAGGILSEKTGAV